MSYLGSVHRDWQLRVTHFVGSSSGTSSTAEPQSREDESTVFTKEQLRALLAAVANSFAEAPLTVFGGRVLLPSRTSIKFVTPNVLVIENPFCRVQLTLQPSPSILYARPGSGGITEALPPPRTGQRYETRTFGLDAAVTYSALHAHHSDMPKHTAWSERFVNELKEWFEGQP